MNAEAVAGGFAAPVFDAQATFRAVLDALARPGRVLALPRRPAPPPPLSPGAAAIALTLLDGDTPVFLDRRLAEAGAVAHWLAFHTGAPRAADPAEAMFALVADPGAAPPLGAFPKGTAEYPDRSATLVVQVATCTGGADAAILAGPGIDGEARLAPAPLPPGFWEQARANHALYPRGVDILFVGPDGIAGLPRSSRILPGGC